jgi:hypothetical protein
LKIYSKTPVIPAEIRTVEMGTDSVDSISKSTLPLLYRYIMKRVKPLFTKWARTG